MIGLRPMCDACIHVSEGEGWTCSAFPKGIPNRIVEDGLDHRNPIKGDAGIRFEQDPAKELFVFHGEALTV
jgi:hypothetical protein